MPQPLRPGSAPSLLLVSPIALSQRPRLAASIGIVACSWAQVEHDLSLLLADLLGTEAKLGIEIFLALRSEGPQRTVIAAAARTRLSKPLAERLVSFLQGDLRDGPLARNDLIHGLWAAAAELPDALIWIDRRSALRVRAAQGRLGFELPGDEVNQLLRAGLKTLVYEENDLTEIALRINSLASQLVKIHIEALTELQQAHQ